MSLVNMAFTYTATQTFRHYPESLQPYLMALSVLCQTTNDTYVLDSLLKALEVSKAPESKALLQMIAERPLPPELREQARRALLKKEQTK